MRILLTGGTGFIGKNLIPLLGEHELLVLSRKEVRLSKGNIRYHQANLSSAESYQNELLEFQPEACINLAWNGIPDYSLETCMNNLQSQVIFLNVLKTIGCQKIFTSGSCWEYGDAQGEVKESDHPKRRSLFAATKCSIYMIGESLFQKSNVQFTWGRIFFVFGQGQREGALIPSCLKTIQEGRSPIIQNPHAVQDFIHVNDVASAIVKIIESSKTSGIYNIGSGRLSRVSDVVRLIAESYESKQILIDSFGAPSENNQGFYSNISRIKNETGWAPKLDLKEGIQKVIENAK